MKPTIEHINKKIEQSLNIRYTETIESNRIGLEILNESQKLNYEKGIIYGKLILAITNFLQVKDEHVFEYLIDAYDYFSKVPKENGLLLTLDVLGSYYDNEGDYEKALSYLNEGIIASKNIDFKEGEADILSSLGKVYLRLNNYDKAISSFTSSLEIREEKNLKLAQASALNLLGRAHSLKGSYEDAISFYEQSVSIRKELNDLNSIVWSYIGLASMYETMGNHNKSISYYERASDSNKSINDHRLEFQISKGLGNIYLLQSEYDLAKVQILPLINIAKKTNSKPLLFQAYYLLSSYYEKIEEFEEAYKNHRNYIQLKEEVINTTTQNRIAHKQAEFEIINAKKEAEIYQLKNVDLKQAYDQIEEKNTEITDSIKYAFRIQTALMPEVSLIKKYIPNSFVLYLPKDIISGDFYWFGEKEGKLIIAAADCTGHGVPGALMSMLGITFLTEIITNITDLKANFILEKLRKRIIQSLKQKGVDGESKDGMDISLIIYDSIEKTVQFSGAYNPIYLIRNSELIEYKADRMPIGIHHRSSEPFTNHEIELKTNDSIYLFSDGFPDQFGGEEGKKYKYKPFKEFLLSIQKEELHIQKELINKEFDIWKGDNEQVDDVVILGIKI